MNHKYPTSLSGSQASMEIGYWLLGVGYSIFISQLSEYRLNEYPGASWPLILPEKIPKQDLRAIRRHSFGALIIFNKTQQLAIFIGCYIYIPGNIITF